MKNRTVVYTALFVNDIHALKEKYPSVHKNQFYHHSTIAFSPSNGLEDVSIGKKIDLRITGRVTTDKVDVLLVENNKSENKHPFLTLSTVKGIKPFVSKQEVAKALEEGTVIAIEDSVEVTEGYFNGKFAITTSRVYLGSTPSGIPIYDRDKESHLHEDGVAELLPEIFSSLEKEERFMKVVHDFGRVVGRTSGVETTPEDEIVFLKRKNRKSPSRFALNRETRPCSTAVIVLLRQSGGDEDYYVLITAYIGADAPREPGDKFFKKGDQLYSYLESRNFWSTHALVFNPSEIEEGAEEMTEEDYFKYDHLYVEPQE